MKQSSGCGRETIVMKLVVVVIPLLMEEIFGQYDLSIVHLIRHYDICM